MAKFVHQGFLQKYPFEDIELEQYRIPSEEYALYLDYKEQTALSDALGRCIRTINLSELDGRLATQEDWKTLKSALCQVQSIVLLDDRPLVENIIVKKYADRTLRIYIRLFLLEGKECRYVTINSN